MDEKKLNSLAELAFKGLPQNLPKATADDHLFLQ